MAEGRSAATAQLGSAERGSAERGAAPAPAFLPRRPGAAAAPFPARAPLTAEPGAVAEALGAPAWGAPGSQRACVRARPAPRAPPRPGPELGPPRPGPARSGTAGCAGLA